MAGNVDHGCVVPLSCGSPGPAPRPPPPLRVVAAGLSQPSGSRLTPCGALCPQPRAVPGPHLGRHRRRLRHGRRGRRHLALRQGGVQLAKGPPKPGAGRLLGACRLAHVAWPYWLQLESRHTAGQLCCNTSHATVVAALPLLLAAQTMRFQAPNLGGSFAVWGGLFSAFDCTLVAVRKKVCAVVVQSTRKPRSDALTLCRRTRGMPSRQAR